MTSVMQALIVAGAGLGGIGVYLLMPRGQAVSRNAGIGLSAAGLALLWIIWWSNFQHTGFGTQILFCLMASQTVVSGVMTITQRSSVACALWFALVVLGTAGLFLLQNAQFLAAAIVIVYAGAIIVMFLFVIMLAHQAGGAVYDRVAREPALAVGASFVMLAVLLSAIVRVYGGAEPQLTPTPGTAAVSESAQLDVSYRAPAVAELGRALFVDHWLSLEVAGTMLLVALVGAVVITARKGRAHEAARPTASGTGVRSIP